MKSIARILLTISFLSFQFAAISQKKPAPKVNTPPLPAATSAEDRMKGFAAKQSLKDNSLLNGVPFTNIGPTIMSGRVVDIDVNPNDPTEFYVAYATGGVWVTRTNGQSFEPVFDSVLTTNIGDIAVDWNRGEIIWVGTGESNSSRSSYAGTGIYKSEDKGKTWSHKGLAETHHIGKIILHPNNPDVVWVAAVGHLYSFNHERGVYKTSDGGKTWKQTLYINPKTGAIDMEIDPKNPDILYASMWERERYSWNFVESGGGSGIYRSNNGGEAWEVLSRPGSGFPVGEKVGRIGLAVYPQNPNIIYALLDNQDFRPKDPKAEEKKGLTKNDLRNMSKKDFLMLEAKVVDQYLKDNNFPEKYNAKSIIQMIEKDQIIPAALVTYLEDANQQLFDTPIIGAELYRSDDAGRTWRKTHTDHLDGIYYTYGYYFGKMNVSPADPDKVYLYGVDIVKSEDGGKQFTSILKENVHVDFHGLWINPAKPNHILSANDGGLNMSYDDGKTWNKLNAPPVSQFYFVNVDNARPYNVYGGMQDNGVWYGPSNYTFSNRWHAEGEYPYKELGGGDGMQIAIDTTNQYVYYGYQFGHYFRKHMPSEQVEYITPKHELGERPHRWNWQTPVVISKHNPSIIYMGSNHFHRSLDFGKSFPLKSKDLTSGGKKGDVPYGTLTTIDESTLRFGLLYAGSDDGLVHVSKDAGQSWENISKGLPPYLWVSRVVASSHAEGRVYVSLNGYRFDHFDSYVYVSEDYGSTWTKIGTNLPAEPVNVVAEDPVQAHVIYAGTDHGMYISMDGGKTFSAFQTGMPPVAVHDVAIQARDQEIVIGTHGRSIFKASLKEIQALPKDSLSSPLYVFEPATPTYQPNWGRKRQVWSTAPEAKVKLPVFMAKPEVLSVQIKASDLVLQTIPAKSYAAGFQYIEYDLSIDSTQLNAYLDWLKTENPKDAEEIVVKAADNGKVYLRPGKYTAQIQSGSGLTRTTTLEVKKGRMGFRWGVRPSQREERKIKEFHWD